MDKKPRVAVLLSTYNGEKYLKTQLESIFAQEEVDVTVFASDDCSKDSTISILEEYSKTHQLFYLQNKANKNFTYNFIDLVYQNADKDFDYFSLADQDDYWLPCKIISGIKLLREKNAHLYCSNLTVVDSELKNPKPMNKFKENSKKHAHILLENICTGCTSIFDKEFAMHLLKHYPENIYLHDYWLMLVAAFSSSFVYDSNSYILYRQHGNNQIGSDKQSLASYYKKFNTGKTFRIHLLEELLKGFESEISEQDLKDIKTFMNYRHSFKSKMKIFFSSRFRCHRYSLLRKIKVICNKY